MTSALPPEMAAELENLRDIRLPEDVSWWPPAPGWWAVAVLIGLMVIASALAARHHRRTPRYRALRELRRLKSETALEPATLAAHIEVLLKRIVLQKGDPALATSSGEEWIRYLSQNAHAMPQEIARFVADAPYRRQLALPTDPDRDTLINAAQLWIRRNV